MVAATRPPRLPFTLVALAATVAATWRGDGAAALRELAARVTAGSAPAR